jgi:hypothetical protein
MQLVTIYTMKFIKFKTNLRDKQTYTKVVNDFKNSSCKCIQQELTMSTKWIDRSNYIKVKELLKSKSKEMNKIILRSKSQIDLFE